MGTRQRQRHDDERPGPGGGNANDGGGLSAARGQADQLLRAGDDAIQRALSGNSEEFLRWSRQESGQ